MLRGEQKTNTVIAFTLQIPAGGPCHRQTQDDFLLGEKHAPSLVPGRKGACEKNLILIHKQVNHEKYKNNSVSLPFFLG